MASIKQDVTLGHGATKSATVEPITLPAGERVTILKEWAHHYLVRTASGMLFNIRKELVDPG